MIQFEFTMKNYSTNFYLVQVINLKDSKNSNKDVKQVKKLLEFDYITLTICRAIDVEPTE